jgi:hypothetical protein
MVSLLRAFDEEIHGCVKDKGINRISEHMNIRVTKYNTAFRSANGGYLNDDEWTSVSDVGRTFDGTTFTFENYEIVENRYIAAVSYFFTAKNVHYIKAENLERYGKDHSLTNPLNELYDKVDGNTVFSPSDVGDLVKLVLREYLWCDLQGADNDAKVTFGYDYYMYFHASSIEKSIVDEIFKIGLFAD